MRVQMEVRITLALTLEQVQAVRHQFRCALEEVPRVVGEAFAETMHKELYTPNGDDTMSVTLTHAEMLP